MGFVLLCIVVVFIVGINGFFICYIGYVVLIDRKFVVFDDGFFDCYLYLYKVESWFFYVNIYLLKMYEYLIIRLWY